MKTEAKPNERKVFRVCYWDSLICKFLSVQSSWMGKLKKHDETHSFPTYIKLENSASRLKKTYFCLRKKNILAAPEQKGKNRTCVGFEREKERKTFLFLEHIHFGIFIEIVENVSSKSLNSNLSKQCHILHSNAVS